MHINIVLMQNYNYNCNWYSYEDKYGQCSEFLPLTIIHTKMQIIQSYNRKYTANANA